LVTGFLEVFPWQEIINASVIVPRLKVQFFGYPLPTLLASPYVWGYLLAMYALAFMCGLLYRIIAKRMAKHAVRKVHKNIGRSDRVLRLAIAIGLLIWAVTTSWSPLLLFLSGFTLFEALFSWCALYQVLGRNSCPV
jgi:Na+/glutamate symporter